MSTDLLQPPGSIRNCKILLLAIYHVILRYIFLKYSILLHVNECFASMYILIPRACTATVGHKMTLNSLELELWLVVSHRALSGNQTHVLCQNNFNCSTKGISVNLKHMDLVDWLANKFQKSVCLCSNPPLQSLQGYASLFFLSFLVLPWVWEIQRWVPIIL